MDILKRMMALLLVMLLLATMPITTFAEETTEEEPLDDYVYHYGVPDNGYTGPNLQYFSPYVTNYIYDGTAKYIQCNVFSMYNTLTQQVIPAYCTDIHVGALANRKYRRQDLEDSTYAADAAEQIRAIVLGGFYVIPDPNETLEEHAVRAKAKVKEIGTAIGIEDLTVGEAIAGTQTAIWQAAHGSLLEFTDFVRSIYTTKVPSASKYYDLCNEERTNGHIVFGTYGALDPDCDAYLNARIKAVYDYLLTLPPVAPNAEMASESSFIRMFKSAPKSNEDGTYDLSVTTTVDVDMAASDTLTLTAQVNDTYKVTTNLSDGEQTCTLTIENVPAELAQEDVVVAIDGTQTASDVYLFDAYGSRESGQSMVAAERSATRVHVEKVAETSRAFHIHKTTGEIDGVFYPLQGISFDLYFAATMENVDQIDLSAPKEYAYSGDPIHTAVTDAEGYACVNFDELGLQDGVYLVVERPHPAISEPIDPFFILMPFPRKDGTGYDYDFSVYPKNAIKGTVQIEKDVLRIGNDEGTVDAYADHTWIIGTNIPEDIADGKSFVISDTLDSRLDYIGNVVATVETTDGSSVLATLSADTDYQVAVQDVDSLSEGNPADSFTFRLTLDGMKKIAASIPNGNFAAYRLRVYFDAQINANAALGEQIPNQADLAYTNSVNFDFYVQSDKPVVNTGGIKLVKVDSKDETVKLSGAAFEVYRNATEAEVAAGGDEVTRIEGVVAPVVKVSFFDNPELQGEKLSKIVSDENGEVGIYGLALGEYYLVETKAPEGYNLLQAATVLIIDETSHTEERVVKIANVSGTILPETGGIGTTIFTAFGIALMGVSMLVLIARKKCRE